ncbi:MAG: hypothetical protein J7L21_04595 [Sulfurimonas sp.]|nr:hypothetical protein [Sulfurimonas sp.]
MTYGEAHIAELNSICLVDGIWKKTLHIENKPKPMNRKDAARYYNIKLFAYWMDQLDDRISIIKKS